MASPTQITDHAAQAVEMLLHVLQDDDTALPELVRILGDEVQDAEDLAWDCIAQRYVTTAVGVQLDQWGRILGKSRGSLSDAAYRRILLAWQGGLRSAGIRDAILRAWLAVCGATTGAYVDRSSPGIPGYELVALIAGGPPLAAEIEMAAEEIAEGSATSGVPYRLVVGDDLMVFRFDTAGHGFDDGLLSERLT